MPPAVRRAALVLVGLLLVGLLAGAAAWRVSGGRWLVIETGSMGTAAPVGTLVLTRPTTVGGLHPGDIVSFRTPAGEVYTHRVTKIADGIITSKGDNNGTVDPYRTTERDLVGKVVARWQGVGFLVRALPYLLVLMGLLWLVTRRVRVPWRTAVRLLGASLVVAAIVLVQRPLVGAEVASSVSTAHGVRASVVSTGLLPSRIHAAGGSSADLYAGQLATVTGSQLNEQGQLRLVVSPHPTGWWWVAVVLACGLPLLIGLRLGMNPESA